MRKGIWQYPEQACTLAIVGNSGVLAEHTVSESLPACEIDIAGDGLLWLRAELWGTVRGVHALIAFTNAIYFDR